MLITRVAVKYTNKTTSFKIFFRLKFSDAYVYKLKSYLNINNTFSFFIYKSDSPTKRTIFVCAYLSMKRFYFFATNVIRTFFMAFRIRSAHSGSRSILFFLIRSNNREYSYYLRDNGFPIFTISYFCFKEGWK